MSSILGLNRLAWRRETRRRIRESHDTEDAASLSRLISILDEPKTVLEIGCHVGSDTEIFAQLCTSADIWAFEADPEQYVRAWLRVSPYKNVHLIPAAVGSECGVFEFFRSGGTSSASGSLLRPTHHLNLYPEVTFEPHFPIHVATVTLESWGLSAGVTEIDLLWMDVQGAELSVARGMGDLLGRTRFIYAEASKKALYEDGATASELSEFLEGQGFAVAEIFMPKGDESVGNILFRNMKTGVINAED